MVLEKLCLSRDLQTFQQGSTIEIGTNQAFLFGTVRDMCIYRRMRILQFIHD